MFEINFVVVPSNDESFKHHNETRFYTLQIDYW